MCCMTHRDRDEYDDANGVPYVMATSDNTRCRCDYEGEACRRFADGEDLLCEWCRAHEGKEEHTRACYEYQKAYTDMNMAQWARRQQLIQWPGTDQMGPESIEWRWK